jgi:hypothetical protein
VGVNVHKPGSYNQTGGIDDARGTPLNVAHGNDPAPAHANVAAEGGQPQAIDNGTVFN